MENPPEIVAPSPRPRRKPAAARRARLLSSVFCLASAAAVLAATGALFAGCGAGTGTPDPIPSPSLAPTPTPSASPVPTPSPLPADPALVGFEQDAFNAVNAARAQLGLPAFGRSEALVQAARRQSQYNAVNNFAVPTHIDGSGQGVAGRVTMQGYSFIRVGEVLLFAGNQPNPATFALTQWAESPQHSALLFDRNLDDIGIAMWQNNGLVHVTAVVAER